MTADEAAKEIGDEHGLSVPTPEDVAAAKTRDELLPGYAWVVALLGCEGCTAPDVATLNRAIMAKWGKNALTKLKEKAWGVVMKCGERPLDEAAAFIKENTK